MPKFRLKNTSSIAMKIALYITSIPLWILLHCILTSLLGLTFVKLTRLGHGPGIPADFELPVIPCIFSGTVTLLFTEWIWGKMGYSIGWFFPVIIAFICLRFGHANRNATPPNKMAETQYFGGLIGCIIYGILIFFR